MRNVHVHLHDNAAFESKHPRKDDGKFGTGTGAARSASKHLTLTERHRKNGEAWLRLQKEEKLPVSRLFNHAHADPEDVLTGSGKMKSQRVETVRVADLIPTQAEVTKAGIARKLRNEDTEKTEVEAIRSKGKLYLLEGHHRVVAARVSGIYSLPINVMSHD